METKSIINKSIVISRLNENKNSIKQLIADDQFVFINQNISYIKKILNNLCVIKREGMYKILNKNLTPININNKKAAIIELAAIKYVSKDLYVNYYKKIDLKKEFDNANCEICNLAYQIWNVINNKYEKIKNAVVKRSDYNLFQDKTATAIEINSNSTMYRFDKIIFVIRPYISRDGFPKIICNNKQLLNNQLDNFDLIFNKLNKASFNYLQALWIQIDKKVIFSGNEKINRKLRYVFSYLTNKEILLLKINFLSYLQNKILKSDELKEWMELVYQNKILQNDKINYLIKKNNPNIFKKSKIFKTILQSFDLQNLKYFFIKMFLDYNYFLDFFNEFIDWYVEDNLIIDILKEPIIYIDLIQVFLNFEEINKTHLLTKKRDSQIFNLNSIVKTIYSNGKYNTKLLLMAKINKLDISLVEG